ncbi:hypothetical protein L596_018243 [Steinernema carpocapsae]|uniref:AN1-type domain-containing protein n=1 Tax=Steinernema carpocapsae TaxID=34508 RepID=A0A4U5N524_STECR|nr:hypothetical protein L596_018243 [Steinernema carpocapsae]
MAEFPDLGKHCALTSCEKLDFTPYKCNKCEKYFCGDHRLTHGCLDTEANASIDATKALSSRGLRGSDSSKSYPCAATGCLDLEKVVFSCEYCKKEFCVTHRHLEGHSCTGYNSPNQIEKRRQEELKKSVKEKMAPALAQYKEDNALKPTLSPPKTAKAVSPTQQARMDRIAIMKLKQEANLHRDAQILPADQYPIFAKVFEPEERRVAVMTHKKWTVGRTVDKIAKDLKIENRNGVAGSKKLRIYKSEDDAEAIEFSENLKDHFAEGATLVFKRDL